MESNNNEIFFNFSYYALNLLGKQMYTNRWSAISELVANGLDAGAKTVHIYINSIEKKRSTIEIFDNGGGMSYSDLVNKYALIGRNKREEEEYLSDKTKGRKGVGKLAALFLSKKYYIVTKKNGIESSWVLDSINAKDSEIPKLDKIRNEDVDIENQQIWNTYAHGTLIKLTNVDMSNFADEKLRGLKARIADYYILDNLGAQIEVAYITKASEPIKYHLVKKEVAFKNFYAFFESVDNLKSTELSESIYMKLSKRSNYGITQEEEDEINGKKRKVIVFKPADLPQTFKVVGEKEFLDLNGNKIKLPYELKGWIGIHATININEARKNDVRFTKGEVYDPNRLRLYIRDKLAVENFLAYLDNNQALSNYIEGEITFDILDDDRLEDISTTSREGLAKGDERVVLLIDILKVIVNRLIRERILISNVLREEVEKFQIRRLENERKAREAERKAKEEERKAKAVEIEARVQAEKKSQKLDIENKDLKEKNISLKTQNDIKDILLNESDPRRQKLLVHELTGISNQINYVIDDMADDFLGTKEFERVVPYLADLKKGSDKLSTIKQQFLKLNTYDIIGKQTIDLKSYIRSYFENVHLTRTEIQTKVGDIPYLSKVEIFELGVLLDNLISNAVEREASFIRVEFLDNTSELRVISDTGPIEIEPVEDIFKLGVSSKKNGTGIGMYLSREICEDFGWIISVGSRENIVEFTVKLEVQK